MAAAKLPNPPSLAELAKAGAETHRLPAGTLLWRVYFASGKHPTFWDMLRAFGPTDARFDHHLPPPRAQERAIGYFAQDVVTPFAEIFQRTRTIDRHRSAPALVGFSLARDMQLLDLRGAWPTRAGASMKINSGPRSVTRLWSQNIYAAFPAIDGLWYASSMHANSPAIALYERGKDALSSPPLFHRDLNDARLLAVLKMIASEIGYGLI